MNSEEQPRVWLSVTVPKSVMCKCQLPEQRGPRGPGQATEGLEEVGWGDHIRIFWGGHRVGCNWGGGDFHGRL